MILHEVKQPVRSQFLIFKLQRELFCNSNLHTFELYTVVYVTFYQPHIFINLITEISISRLVANAEKTLETETVHAYHGHLAYSLVCNIVTIALKFVKLSQRELQDFNNALIKLCTKCR